MAERDYSGLIPTAPPEGVLPWLFELGKLEGDLLVYKMGSYIDPLTEQKTRAVELKCSACGCTIYADRADGPSCSAYAPASFGFVHPFTGEHHISQGHCLCPSCDVPVQIFHTGSIPNGRTVSECWPLTVSRIEDKLALIGWRVWKHIDKCCTVTYYSHGYEAYVVEQKKVIRLSACTRYINNISWHEWRQRKAYRDGWGESFLTYPWDASLLIGSTAENSKLDKLLRDSEKTKSFPITYLRLWQKRPNVENLVMAGAARLLVDGMEADCYNGYDRSGPTKQARLNWVNWKENSPYKMLGMTRDEYKACMRDKWSVSMIAFRAEELASGRTLSQDDMKLVKYLGVDACREIKTAMSRDYIKAARYLRKQSLKDKRCTYGILRDYWRIAAIVGEDMTLPPVLFPPNLMRAHDRVEQVRSAQEEFEALEKDKDKAALFNERYQSLLHYSWEHNGIFIRPAASAAELRAEGKALNHCVGSYAETHIKGDSPIFFIRRASEPDTPWYTLQLNVKTLNVSQNRGRGNCARTSEVEAFEQSWLAWCREQSTQAKPKRKSKPKKEGKAA